MEKITYKVIIRLTDGTFVIIEGVTEYRYNDTSDCFIVVKNGYNQFFNKSQVVYIGREFDLTNQVRGYSD